MTGKSPGGTATRHPLPTFDELQHRSDAPPGSAWGLFGAQDRLGTVNFLTPQRVIAAAALVRLGQVYSLNWSLALPEPPLFHRRALRRDVDNFGTVHDDHYADFYPQGSSQWDALAHVDHPVHGSWNGLPPGYRATIDHLAERGIAGRFLLIDIARHRAETGRDWDPGAGASVTTSELDEVLQATGHQVQPGDVVLIRLAWTQWWLDASETERDRVRRTTSFPGLSGSIDTARWLWDHQVAAIATDAPSIEVLPVRGGDHLHPVLLGLLGVTVGELFDLERLSVGCDRAGVWAGLFTAAPLNLVGGFGSTANALAVL